MSCFYEFFNFKCLSCSNKNDNQKNEEEFLPQDFNNIPTDMFLCPEDECGEVPEILKIYTDIGKMELKCEKCGIIEIPIEKYYLSMKKCSKNYKSPKYVCENCKKTKMNEESFKYCYECQKDLCNECFSDKKIHQNHNYINVNEKRNKCLKHYDEEVTQYCKDCHQNVCSKEINNKHKGHDLITLSTFKFKSIKKCRELIEEKNKLLSEQFRFNKLVLNTCSNFPYNYNHMKSVINIGKSIEKENLRISKDINCVFYEIANKTKSCRSAIDSFKDETNYYLNENDEFLHLFKGNKDRINNENNNQNDNNINTL